MSQKPLCVVDSVDQLRQDFWSGAVCKCEPPQGFRFSDFLVRDQEAVGSNPIAPTNYFTISNFQAHELWLIAWCWARRLIVQVLSLRPLQIPTFHWFTLHLLFRQQQRFV